MTNSMNQSTVRSLVQFQKTGSSASFDAFWADAESFIEKKAASWLVKHFVTGVHGGADESAVDDVKQRVGLKLSSLPHKTDRSGWFDPDRFGWRPDRLRAWLHPIIQHEAVEHCKDFHGLGRKGLAAITFSDLEFNEGGSSKSAIDIVSEKIDFDAFELREIVAECVAELPEESQGLCRRLFVEGLSQHEVGRRLAVSASTVCRHWAALSELLEQKLAARGIDAGWLDRAA